MDEGISTVELENFIKKDKFLLEKVEGVFSSDLIPNKISSGKFYIVNTDSSSFTGKHWVTIHFPLNSLPEFFDSLGKCPSSYSYHILDVLVEHGLKGFVYNYNRLQASNSSYCGLYCLYFIYYRSRGICFEDILRKFEKKIEKNDNIIKVFISKMFS